MTDTTHEAPERIKVWPTYDSDTNDWSGGFWSDTEEPIGTTYVRADRIEALTTERYALREAVDEVTEYAKRHEAERDALAVKLAETEADLRTTKISAVFWQDGWRALKRVIEAKLTQQDDDFYPASAGDDPIWIGTVEYITKQRSDDLVAAERERCAKVSESFGCCHVPQEIADAIREGGE